MAKKTTQSKPEQGQVRIIGGDFRGRKLPVCLAEGLRPTSDRMRETLFNWLQFDLAGRRCLDVFAGSGALGFEALSRGAKQVTMLELNRQNAQQLQTNQQVLKVDNLQIIQTNALNWLAKENANAPFEVVFCDPPFGQNLLEPTLDKLFKNNYIHPERGILYLEQEKTQPWPSLPASWACIKEKQTSQVKVGLFKRKEA